MRSPKEDLAQDVVDYLRECNLEADFEREDFMPMRREKLQHLSLVVQDIRDKIKAVVQAMSQGEKL
jgi:hypothetical protein